MRDVAFSCDDAGAKFLCVTVYSLLKNYRGDEPVRINILEGYGGHSPANRVKLAKVVAAFPSATLRYIDVEAAIRPYEKLLRKRVDSRWNIFTWAPIFVPQVLPDATGNVLHLDIDMLVTADVSELFALDLGENLIAAVAEYGKGDPVITEAVWGKGILPESVKRYFNTGTILFNIGKCRAERTWEKILAWYESHYEIASRIEQDAWNALYHDRTYLLPLKWNFHDRLMKTYLWRNPDDSLWQGNPPRECLEAALHPSILHFWGPKKPWRISHRPYRKLYHDAMREVGQDPPKEPIFAFYYNIVNKVTYGRIHHIAWRLKHAWDLRRRTKARHRLFLAPFEWFGIAMGFLVFAFLPHCALLRVCDFVAWVYYLFDRQGRAFAWKNLEILYGSRLPQCRAKRIVRGSYRNMCRTIGHAFWTCLWAKKRVQKVGEMSADGCRFLAEHKPAITVSAHLGCWEILSQLAFLHGHQIISVAKDVGTSGMTRLLMRSRRSIGQEIISSVGAFKPLMAALNAGKSLGLIVDQSVSPRRGGQWIMFFGRPMPVSPAPAFFSAKTGLPIAIAWSRPLKNGHYRCDVVKIHEASEARNIWRLTQELARDLEGVIRRHPSVWVLNYNYFSRHPTAEELKKLKTRS